ncbi:MAG: hypothetical protein KAR06_02365 [Deltaproteobacteria bacterium]|nr:hypothetical protein [Deltaproteobacteria bacterium]
MECDFCGEEATCSGVKFAGDHSPATGPFNLCEDDLRSQVEFNGLPMGDYKIINAEKFERAVWED